MSSFTLCICTSSPNGILSALGLLNSEDANVLYSSSCQDILYEGRLIARQRPLIAYQVEDGTELWKVDLSAFTNDLRCEPSKPIIFSKGKRVDVGIPNKEGLLTEDNYQFS